MTSISNHSHDTKGSTNPMRLANFRRFWLGNIVSSLGDQFFIVALPWIILHMTGSGVALGTVLMLVGIPRLIFMVVGGVLSDRFSPRMLLLFSNIGRGILAAILAVLVILNMTRLWMLYIVALGFGVTDAFFYPAMGALMPQLVAKEQLQKANAFQQGGALVAQSIGPGLAGFAITFVREGGAFALDALSYLFASLALVSIRDNSVNTASHAAAIELERQPGYQAVVNDIRAGLQYVKANRTLRVLLFVSTMVSFLFTGPMQVGPAQLAMTRFPQGVTALGLMGSAGGFGSLLGVVLATRFKPRRLVLIALSGFSVSGSLIIAIGFSTTVWMAAILSLMVGVISGCINVLYFTWIQNTVPSELLGRVMSLALLAAFGLVPLSNALAGVLAQIDVALMYACAGGLLIVTCMGLLLKQNIRVLDATAED